MLGLNGLTATVNNPGNRGHNPAEPHARVWSGG